MMKWKSLGAEKPPMVEEASIPVLVRTEDSCYFSARYFLDDGMAYWYFYFDNSQISADASDLWVSVEEVESTIE